MEASKQHELVKHRQAAIIWIACLIVAALMAFVTLQMVSAGHASSPLEVGGLVVGWLVVVVFCGTALTIACESATITQGGCITFTWQYPLWRTRESYEVARINAPVVVKKVDSDGDDYYVAQVDLPDGRAFILTQGIKMSSTTAAREKSKARCEAACVQFSETIARVTG